VPYFPRFQHSYPGRFTTKQFSPYRYTVTQSYRAETASAAEP
jgi:hypothetical protein